MTESFSCAAATKQQREMNPINAKILLIHTPMELFSIEWKLTLLPIHAMTFRSPARSYLPPLPSPATPARVLPRQEELAARRAAEPFSVEGAPRGWSGPLG